ncbi:hypothetical protein UUU_45090 [Klebsiella pneumoniae subsp. pneumoniae DSM 30104 = JCM 1662 = NBRC 14940]|nr:hypothetical protein UUU_45090 [Klebsiella pneumoniae subsp. pneumoniae DSM 30104 = JCM 1662 = NBRC 14940]
MLILSFKGIPRLSMTEPSSPKSLEYSSPLNSSVFLSNQVKFNLSPILTS